MSNETYVKNAQSDVTPKEKEKEKEKEGKQRSVSFNRDVHVKRFGESHVTHSVCISVHLLDIQEYKELLYILYHT